MRSYQHQSLFLLILIAGMSLSATSEAQIAPDAASKSETQAASRPMSKVDLSQKSVLILHGLESNVPIFELTDRGIRKVLESAGVGTRNQFFEYLDLVRNPGPEHRALMAEFLRQRYGQRKIDLVITLYPEALHFAVGEGYKIFSGVPIIALYLPVGFKLPPVQSPVVLQPVAPDISGTLRLALKLIPELKVVYVVSGAHSIDKWLESKAREDFRNWGSPLEFRFLSDMPLDEILTTVSEAPASSIVLITAFQKDVTGEIFTTVSVGEKLSKTSKAPVFGLFESMIGHGIVGGSLQGFEYVGTKAAEMGLDILRKAQNPENIPTVLNVPYLSEFDWKMLKHWNLNEDNLPAGSIIINREATFWDFKYHILGGLIFIFGQSFLIFVLLAQRRRRRSAEVALQQKRDELDKFFSMSLDLLCIADTEGYFLRLNPAWERILGYTHEELMAARGGYYEMVRRQMESQGREDEQVLR